MRREGRYSQPKWMSIAMLCRVGLFCSGRGNLVGDDEGGLGDGGDALSGKRRVADHEKIRQGCSVRKGVHAEHVRGLAHASDHAELSSGRFIKGARGGRL